MTLYTSTQFASAAETGTDWRDISKKVLEQLSAARTPDDGFNIGFLYISDLLAEDAQSILSLFQSVTGIDNWVGSCGMAVAGCGHAFVDEPAISAMIGYIDEDKCRSFFTESSDHNEVKKKMSPWTKGHDPMLVLLHGNSITERNPDFTIGQIAQQLGGFTAGGLTSSRGRHVHFAGELREEGFSGIAFSTDIPVRAAMSQGCVPISDILEITRADGHVIMEINGQKPFDVFSDTLKKMAKDKTGKDPDDIFVPAAGMPGESIEIPDEFKHVFRGEVHIALPVAGSDMQDYMVRDIIGIDPEEGVIATSQKMETGDKIMFVHRDDDTVRNDLTQTLVNLRKRIQHETGSFAPKAALYYTCIARAQMPFTVDGCDELALVREIIGDVPLTGFYANGEISAGRHYRYTGILVLFV
jgi:small ligand-binding sensory domain FIST